jgi:GDP-4-dehydro-6-deoxy-D-mannose reductase
VVSNRVLVTGCGGFVGRHLCQALRLDNRQVIGIDRSGNPGWVDKIVHGDVAEPKLVKSVIEEYRPDWIINLAAIASPRICDRDPRACVEVNVQGALNVLSASEIVPDSKILIIGTAHEYRIKPGDSVVYHEDDPLGAESIYGISKELSERLILARAKATGQQVYVTRSFNHTGPHQSDEYAIGNFVHQANEVSAGRRDAIEVKSLDVWRDITDVRDVTNAYIAILERGEPMRPYNVCCGRPIHLQSILQNIMALAGCGDARIDDTSRGETGASGSRRIAGNPSRVLEECGWTSGIPIEETISDMIEADRNG